jgi:toxin ParE1/3/4
MPESHRSYVLSQEADKDLEDIFDYTADKFGVSQAIEYVSSFDEVFIHLSINPKLGRERNEIKRGLRSPVKDSHVIFYRVMQNHIRIVRVLHASRDVVKFIPPSD